MMLPFGFHSKRSKYPSVRLFENPWLEALSHVHPLVPLLLWGPIFVVCMWRACSLHRPGLSAIAVACLSGILAWTLLEYLMHRFAFHYEPRSDWGRRLTYLFHGNHHDDPNDPTRLVMPPIVSLTLGALIYVLCQAALPPNVATLFFCGMIMGYLAYDYIHYATHHFKPRTAVGRYLRRHHMSHHFRDHHAKWGVSSPLWDIVFGTLKSRDTK